MLRHTICASSITQKWHTHAYNTYIGSCRCHLAPICAISMSVLSPTVFSFFASSFIMAVSCSLPELMKFELDIVIFPNSVPFVICELFESPMPRITFAEFFSSFFLDDVEKLWTCFVAVAGGVPDDLLLFLLSRLPPFLKANEDSANSSCIFFRFRNLDSIRVKNKHLLDKDEKTLITLALHATRHIHTYLWNESLDMSS